MSNWKTACKWIIIVSLLFLAVPIRVKNPKDANTLKLFHNFMSQFNRTYAQGSPEYDKRFKIFKETLSHISALNHGRPNNHSAVYGLTQFSDLTGDEFMNQYLDKVKRLSKRQEKKRKWRQIYTEAITRANASSLNNLYLQTKNIKVGEAVPLRVDWREKALISEVASQGLCGACWAYSAIEVAEAMAAKVSGNLTKFSVQEMIDCAGNGNFGCKGGDICSLLSWLKTNNINIYTDHDYPTSGSSGDCMYQKINQTQKTIKIKEFSCESYFNRETDLIRTLANVGPVAVAINALTWQYYTGGVVQHHCPGDMLSLNHAVQIVGYDLTAEVPYYIAKNSWGKSFGINGYLRLAIGENVCGLALEVSTVQVM